jgi:hypothetical protein
MLSYLISNVDQYDGATNNNWETVVSLDGSLFEANKKYFFFVVATLGGTDNTVAAEVQVLRGGTLLTGSDAHLTMRANTGTFRGSPYQFMTVFTQGSTPGKVELQIKKALPVGGTKKVYAIEVQIFALKIHDLTAGVDYKFTEVTTPVTLSSSLQALATVNVNLATGDHWILLGHANVAVNQIIDNSVIDFLNPSVNSSYVGGSSHALGQSTSDQYSHVIGNIWLPTATGNLNGTVLRGVEGPSAGAPADVCNSARVFMLRLGALGPNLIKQSTIITAPTGGAWADLAGHTHSYSQINADQICFLFATEIQLLHPNYTQYRLLGYDTADRASTVEVLPDGFQDAAIPESTSVVEQLPFFRIGVQRARASPRSFIAQVTSDNPGGADNVISWSFLADRADGSGTIAIPAASLAGTGTFEYLMVGDGELRLPLPPVTGSGGYVLDPRDGVSGLTTAAPQFSGTGEFTVPPRVGDDAVCTLPVPAVSGSGTYTIPGCDPLEYAEHGREPVSICQQFRMGTDYPLIKPSDDIRNLLADFFLAYEEPGDYSFVANRLTQPFRIAWLFGYGCLPSDIPNFTSAATFHNVDLVIVDAFDQPVFDSTQAASYHEQAWGDRLMLHEWRTESAVCRIVVHTKWHASSDSPEPQFYELFIMPDSAVIDSRTIRRMPQRIRKLVVNGSPLAGEVELISGYNVAFENAGPIASPTTTGQLLDALLAIPTAGGRAGYKIEFDGTPGGGAGHAPGCDSVEPAFTTINGIGPDAAGHFLLNGAAATEDVGCYWFQQPDTRADALATVTSATLQLNNDCRPCCTCDDFVQVKLGIDSVFKRWQSIATHAQVIRDSYKTGRARWLAQKVCREAKNQKLKLTSNCAGFIGIGYSFCSNLSTCEGRSRSTFLFW